MLAAVTRSSSLRYLPFPTRSQNLWMSILFRLQCLLPLLRAAHHRASWLRPQTVPSRRFPHPPRVPTGGSLRQNPEPKPDWWFCSRALLKTLFFVDLLKYPPFENHCFPSNLFLQRSDRSPVRSSPQLSLASFRQPQVRMSWICFFFKLALYFI